MTDSNLSPMMAVRWPAAFSDPDWYFEPKCDGYRVIASTDGTVHRLRSRSGLDFTDTYPDISNPCGVPAVIDGEIVALDADGKPSFSLLQRRSGFRRKRESVSVAPLVVMVFDLLQLDGVRYPDPLAGLGRQLEIGGSLGCALGRIRTYAPGSGGQCSIP